MARSKSKRRGAASPTKQRHFDRARRFLAANYPALKFAEQGDGTAVAVGDLAVLRPDGSPDSTRVGILFNRGFPRQPPRVFDIDGRWPTDPDRHILTHHEFCLALKGVNGLDLSDDAGLAAFMADLVIFIRQQLICDAIGRFPGPTWPHGWKSAYALHVLECLEKEPEHARGPLWEAIKQGPSQLRNRAACPCGSGAEAKRCHRPLVKQLWNLLSGARSRVGVELADLTYAELKGVVNETAS